MFILESEAGAGISGRESSETTVKTTGIAVSQSMGDRMAKKTSKDTEMRIGGRTLHIP